MKYIEVCQDGNYYIVNKILNSRYEYATYIEVPNDIALLIEETLNNISNEEEVLIPIKEKYSDLTKDEIVTRFKTLTMTKNELLFETRHILQNKYSTLVNMLNVLTINNSLYSLLYENRTFDYTDSTSYDSELSDFISQLTQFIDDNNKVNEFTDNIEIAVTADQLNTLQQQIKTLLE